MSHVDSRRYAMFAMFAMAINDELLTGHNINNNLMQHDGDIAVNGVRRSTGSEEGGREESSRQEAHR